MEIKYFHLQYQIGQENATNALVYGPDKIMTIAFMHSFQIYYILEENTQVNLNSDGYGSCYYAENIFDHIL